MIYRLHAHTKEIVFLQERNENITIGGWSQIETILFIHVIGHIERKGQKATLNSFRKCIVNSYE